MSRSHIRRRPPVEPLASRSPPGDHWRLQIPSSCTAAPTRGAGARGSRWWIRPRTEPLSDGGKCYFPAFYKYFILIIKVLRDWLISALVKFIKNGFLCHMVNWKHTHTHTHTHTHQYLLSNCCCQERAPTTERCDGRRLVFCLFSTSHSWRVKERQRHHKPSFAQTPLTTRRVNQLLV